jgi:hypothetical protein
MDGLRTYLLLDEELTALRAKYDSTSGKAPISDDLFRAIAAVCCHTKDQKSDMCEYCLLYKTLKEREKVQGFLSSEDRKSLDVCVAHKNLVEAQDAEYKKQKENPDEDECIAACDYMSSVKLPFGPLIPSGKFHHPDYISVLTFVCFFNKNREKEKKVFTFLSYCSSKSAFFSCDCLDRLVKSRWFQGICKLKPWSDNGSHFKCNHFVSHALFSYPHLDVQLFQFAEKHGKSEADEFFGNFRIMINYEQIFYQVNNINDLRDLCTKYFKENSTNEYMFKMFVFTSILFVLVFVSVFITVVFLLLFLLLPPHWFFFFFFEDTAPFHKCGASRFESSHS